MSDFYRMSSESEEEEVYLAFADPPPSPRYFVNPPINPPPSPVSWISRTRFSVLGTCTRQRPLNNNHDVSWESDSSGFDVPTCVFDSDSDQRTCHQFRLFQCFENGTKPSSLQHIIKDKVEHILLKEIQASNVQGVRKILAILAYDISECAKPDLNKTMCNGYTALTLAAMRGNATILEELIDSGAETEQENEFGKSALVTAINERHVEAVKVLLDAGAKFDLNSRPLRSLLVKALTFGHDEIVHAVLSRKGRFENNDKYLSNGRSKNGSNHKSLKTGRINNLACHCKDESLRTAGLETLALGQNNESLHIHNDEAKKKSKAKKTPRERCVIQ